jgi:hypothetical protein
MHATVLHYTYLAYIVISKASGILECTMISIYTEVHNQYTPRSVTADTCCFVLWS